MQIVSCNGDRRRYRNCFDFYNLASNDPARAAGRVLGSILPFLAASIMSTDRRPICVTVHSLDPGGRQTIITSWGLRRLRQVSDCKRSVWIESRIVPAFMRHGAAASKMNGNALSVVKSRTETQEIWHARILIRITKNSHNTRILARTHGIWQEQ